MSEILERREAQPEHVDTPERVDVTRLAVTGLAADGAVAPASGSAMQGFSSSQAAPQGSFLNHLWDARTARVLFTALIFLTVLAFFRAAQETLTLFLFAVLFAYFLEPLVSRFEKPLRGRGKAILAVYLLLAAVLAAVAFIAGPKFSAEARALGTSLPSLVNRLSSGELIANFGQTHHWSEDRVNQIQAFLVDHKSDFASYGKAIAAKVAAPASHIWWLILIPILSLFFLKGGKEIAQGTVALGRSAKEKTVIQGLLDDINVMLGSYIRSQIILAGLTLVAYTLVLSLMRVPYAFILGPLAGFLEFIPVVGPAIAAVSVLGISILAGYPHAVWVFLFLGAWRLIQDYVNAPRIMGKSLEIDPLTQIFSVLAGGEIGGVVGALISVPVVAILRILWRRIRTTQEEGPEATGSRAIDHLQQPSKV